MQILESAINKYIALDPELPEKLAQFEGKTICLDITGLEKKLYLLPYDNRIEVRTEVEHVADATLRGSPVALFKMSMMRNVAPLLLKGELEITGDMHLGRAFKALLADMEIDWEEQLSALVGDEIAHELFKGVRRFSEWGKRSGESLAMDVSEYLQEESRDVVTGAELEQFYAGVDGLRMDVERLQAKVDRFIENRQT